MNRDLLFGSFLCGEIASTVAKVGVPISMLGYTSMGGQRLNRLTSLEAPDPSGALPSGAGPSA